jgi:hypothetical protein
MVNAILVDRDLDAGARLIDLLDRNDFPVNAALWYQLNESDRWRLLLVSTLVNRVGKQAAYLKLQELIDANDAELGGNLDLDNITVVSPNDALVKRLPPYRLLTGRSDVQEINTERHASWVQDAYVYRWEPPTDIKPKSPWPITLEDAIRQSVKNSLERLLGDQYPSKVTWDIDLQPVPNIPVTLRRADTGASATGSVNPLLPEVIFSNDPGPMVYDLVKKLVEELRLPTDRSSDVPASPDQPTTSTE